MSITHDDVRHVAALARIGVAPERLPELARELNSILDHMAALSRAEVAAGSAVAQASGMPLRDDNAAADRPVVALESFAPAFRDGFFVVPRLASHDDSGSSA